MGHEGHGPAEVQEIVLQPLHGLQVQVVGGLVQEQDVRALKQHPGQLGPLAPAAGKLADAAQELVLGKAQAREDGPGPVLRIVADAPLQVGLALGEPHELGLVVGRCGLFPLAPELAPGGQGRQDPGQQGLVQVRVGKLLGHVTQARALLHVHLAAVGLHLPGQDAQERALAAAVGPGHGQTHARSHLEGQPVEQVLAAVGLDQIADRDARHEKSPAKNLWHSGTEPIV